MTDEKDIESAETFGRTRATMAPFLGLLVLVVHQGVFYRWNWEANSPFQIAVWVGFIILMLSLLLTGGGWLLPARVRSIANDEATQINRMAGITVGFVGAIVVALLVVVVSPFEPLPAQRAAHMIASMSLGLAFVGYGAAELRSLG
ncbi:hypothetical protein [Alteriqipengyuania sp.]|uniref:hypothetical protein n=1 Tax=Alteriqipengyuania sp. TaxID=2800692 RepID=UPI003516B9F3